MHFFRRSGIKNQDILDEFALLISKKEPSNFYTAPHLFGTLSKMVAKDVIKNCVTIDGDRTLALVGYIKSRENFDPSDCTELGIFCAKLYPEFVRYYSELAPADKDYLEKIATIAFKAGRYYACSPSFFFKLDRPVRIKICHIALSNGCDFMKEGYNCFRSVERGSGQSCEVS